MMVVFALQLEIKTSANVINFISFLTVNQQSHHIGANKLNMAIRPGGLQL